MKNGTCSTSTTSTIVRIDCSIPAMRPATSCSSANEATIGAATNSAVEWAWTANHAATVAATSRSGDASPGFQSRSAIAILTNATDTAGFQIVAVNARSMEIVA